MATPAKKSVPSLSELRKKDADKVEENKDETVTTEPESNNDEFMAKSNTVDVAPTNDDRLAPTGTRFVNPNEDHVHTWEDNPEHNLAKVHPDVIPASPSSDQASVTENYTVSVYADENERDDKGFADKLNMLKDDKEYHDDTQPVKDDSEDLADLSNKSDDDVVDEDSKK